MSELLPEPATPVTAVSTPVGMSTQMFFRLFARAFLIRSCPLGLRTSFLIGSACVRCRAVSVSALRQLRVLPSNTIVPPPCPRPGRRRRRDRRLGSRRGRVRRRSRCCPCRAVSRSSSLRRCTSRGCSPTLGSSKMYITSTRLLPRCFTIRTRCDSPPDSVSVSRLRLRYSSPISTTACSRSTSAFTIGAGLGLFDRAHHLQQLADLHRRQIGDVVPADLARERGRVEARAFARRTLPRLQIRHHRFLRALAERLDVALHVRAFDLGDDAGVGEVDGAPAELRLELLVLAVEQQLHLVLGELAELLVVVEEAARACTPARPSR